MAMTYTVSSGDRLDRIAVKYYGSGERWTDIVRANPQLAGRPTALDGRPTIYPGDVLIVPEDPAAAKTQAARETVVLNDGAPQDFALLIGGKKFTGFTGCTLTRSVKGVDAFSFSSKWDAGDKALRDAFRPFSFTDCEVLYDGDTIFKGMMLPPTPQISPSSQTITVQGYPRCGVLIDSCLPPSLYPAEYNGLDLKQIAETVCGPFGVGVDFEGDAGAAFEKVSVELNDKAWDFLSKLADERGFSMTNRLDGRLLIYKPEVKETSAAFIQGEVPFISCAPDFDKQGMYSHVTGYTKTTAEAESQKYTYENKLLINQGVLRCYATAVDDAEAGDIESATKAVVAEMFANCVKYKLTVSGHRDKNGRLYRENMAVSVKAPGAEIYRETKLLVDDVTLKRDDSAGLTTEFTLVLPGARDGSLPEVFPWEE